MTDREKEALLRVIQHFKKPEMSDLDAALLCIREQAADIRRLQDIIQDFKSKILGLYKFTGQQSIFRESQK